MTIRDVLGGVRSTCTYVGAAKLKELSRRTTFIRVTQQLNTVSFLDNWSQRALWCGKGPKAQSGGHHSLGWQTDRQAWHMLLHQA
ncbi:hypothetical protein JZ751_008942 [Albula glossodonta]|uniref:GMP reductase n=1 Tax=Albula glossodonta TaxID=121402 RepID=A0A8T2PAS4_9TELE|nr:hypothetical protein JZ751_008942 [Albula glossodonta]